MKPAQSVEAETQPRALHAFCDDALGDDDAVALAARLRAKEVSAEEVQRAALARAGKVDPKLRAITARYLEITPAVHHRAEQAAFAAIPTFIKDNVDVKGVPTGQGCPRPPAAAPRQHSRVVRQLMAQGFVILGKTALPEFGFNATTELAQASGTANPWNLSYSSGGSSGGAAALVAAGVVPVAHGNDGGGSIRIPAAACGLVGLKPSRGRLADAEGTTAMPIHIVAQGILSRTVRDTAHFYANVEKLQPAAKLRPIGTVEGPSKRRLRVGLVLDSTVSTTDNETRAAVLHTAKQLESAGHHVFEVGLPSALQTFADDFCLYYGLLAFLVHRAGKAVVGRHLDTQALDNLTLGLSAYYARRATSTPAMLYRLRRSSAVYAAMFDRCDVVLSPVLGHTTPLLGHLSPVNDFEAVFERLRTYASFTPLNNASGAPAISLPLGMTRNRLPIGVHFSAAHGDERTLLELAFELEQLMPWPKIQHEQLGA